MRWNNLVALSAVAGFAFSGHAFAADTPEIEPNDTKAAANPVTLAPGDSLSGTTTGASTTVVGPASSDNFKITVAASPLGIYRNVLSLTTAGTAGHVATIRGLTQTAAGVINPGTDASVQTAFTNVDTGARNVAWYGFGRQEELYYRVAGTVNTTDVYTATLSRSAVATTPLSSNLATPGQYTIRVTGGDPELWIYNADTLSPVPDYNNDDTIGAGLVSTLTRDFPVGNYLIAISDYNLQNNLPSPFDENFRGENVLDFPNAICDSDREATYTAAVEVHEGLFAGPLVATAAVAKTQDFEVIWVSFRVGPPLPSCPADVDNDGAEPAEPDGAVTIDDLLYFLVAFEAGSPGADLDDDGADPALPDGAVTIDDLLFFLTHFEEGC